MLSKKYIIAIVVILPIWGWAQLKPGQYFSSNKKAIRYFEEAQVKYNEQKVEETFNLLQKAIETDPQFIDAYIMRANLYENAGKKTECITDLKKAIEIDASYFPNALYLVAEIQFSEANYQEAKHYSELFLKHTTINEQTKGKAEKIYKNACFAVEAVKNPVPFNPINLGANVNSKLKDYLPSLSADEQTLLFARTLPKDSTKAISRANGQEDFFISKFINNQWTLAKNLGKPINTPYNEGAQSLSPDGQWLVFTGCPDKVYGYPEGRTGQGSCDLFFSIKKGERWTDPKNLGTPINTKYWESQPSISSDGKTIYFVSNRPGGKGGMDIWKSTLSENGQWSNPINLGEPINTPYDEMSPFIHPDNKTFYFSSKGQIGLGGFDLFYCTFNEDGKTNEVKNLGYPINTSGDEFGLIVSSDGKKAFYASEREDGFGDWDIYTFELPDNVRANAITYFKGKVVDATTKKSLGARFELIDLESGKTVVESFSDEVTGEFLICLPPDKEYALNVNKSSYLFYSDYFSLKTQNQKTPYFKEVPLIPIKAGARVVLKNIFFETNKYDLQPQSLVELEKLRQFLIQNPTVNIEISGHTDNVGDKQKNLILSENRAKTVYNYLIDKGITAQRISYKGYGDSQPIDDNKTESGRANNRRTEFIIK
jgi:outer membrane protein OmpA-like peptidoglycan-associated protein